MNAEFLSKDFDHRNSNILRAYRKCRDLELKLLELLETARTLSEKKSIEHHIIDVRIVGHTLNVGPNEISKTYTAESINFPSLQTKSSLLKSWMSKKLGS